jgi:hypothetical protein
VTATTTTAEATAQRSSVMVPAVLSPKAVAAIALRAAIPRVIQSRRCRLFKLPPLGQDGRVYTITPKVMCGSSKGSLLSNLRMPPEGGFTSHRSWVMHHRELGKLPRTAPDRAILQLGGDALTLVVVRPGCLLGTGRDCSSILLGFAEVVDQPWARSGSVR